MTINQAIELACSQGYEHKDLRYDPGEPVPIFYQGKLTKFEVLYDVNFWKSIDKALRWDEEPKKCRCCRSVWIFMWKEFVNHLAKGESAESYFDKLKTFLK